jgi:phytoene dehydrogenase-like protein
MNNRLTPPQAVIIGAGHNGLVTSFYLARAGWQVKIVEARATIGGACISKRLGCGCGLSVAANHFGMLRAEIVKDMKLVERGLHVFVPDPQMVVTRSEGRSIAVYRDLVRTKQEILRFSSKDADNFETYLDDLERAASVLKPMLMAPARTVADLGVVLDQVQPGFSNRFLYGSLAQVVEHYFENEDVQTALAATTILYKASPWTKGTAFALLYLSQYSVKDESVWGLVEGGMGKVTEYMADAVREVGGEILTSTAVKQILIENNCAIGVELEGGKWLKADAVFSNADPYTTFMKLLPRGCVAMEIEAAMKGRDFDGACSKLNLLVDTMPSYASLPRPRDEEARGTLTVVTPNLSGLRELYVKCVNGELGCGSYLEVLCPSCVDPSLRCPKHHTMSVFTIYTPYAPSGGSWREYGPHCEAALIEALETLSPGIRSAISWKEFLNPVDIENQFGMYKGNVDHGNMDLENLFCDRPLPHANKISNQFKNLYLCGAGAHPGGLVSGAPGYNAACQAIKEHGGLLG